VAGYAAHPTQKIRFFLFIICIGHKSLILPARLSPTSRL